MRQFWIVTFSAFALSLVVNGTLPNLVPLLTDRGMPLSDAIGVLSVIGLSGILGRIGTGFLVDVLFAPRVAMAVFLAAALGVGVVWLNSSSVPLVLGAILLGVSRRADVDQMGYLTSRYFSKSAFAKVYDFVFLALIVGQATGVFLMGWAYAVWKSYEPLLLAFAIGIAIASVILPFAGPYVFPPVRAPKDNARANLGAKRV